MKHTCAKIILALAFGSLALTGCATGPARSDYNVSLGSAAYGYRDGYWDRDHNWHGWENDRQARYYRSHYRDHYYDRRHDEDHVDMGWRNDNWWERH